MVAHAVEEAIHLFLRMRIMSHHLICKTGSKSVGCSKVKDQHQPGCPADTKGIVCMAAAS